MTKLNVLSLDEADSLCYQSGKVGELYGYLYSDLVKKLGEPTYNNPNDKSEVEWVIQFNGTIFEIFDWKASNRDYVLNDLDEWSIGGSINPYEFIKFIDAL